MENQVTYTSPKSMGLPLGYRFRPSKRELIEHFLIERIKGGSIPRNPVIDCDVSGDPRIWRKHFEESGMKTLYFYTPLKNRKRGTKKERTTEFGTWDNNSKSLIYDDDDDEEEEHDDIHKRERKHIGLRTNFSLKSAIFENNENWTMHEYKLDGIYKNMPNEDEIVLCQINKIKKKIKVAKDNPHQNIQDEGAQPLDKDEQGKLVSNGQCHRITKDNSHQNIQADIHVWGDMDKCPSPTISSGNWPLDTSYSQDISMDSANGDSEWSELEPLWKI